MKKCPLVLAILAATFLLGPAAALAQDPDMRHLDILELPGKWWKHPRMAGELNLTTAQIDRIEGIFLEYRKKLADVKAQMEKYQLDFEQAAGRPEIDRAQILRLLELIAPIRTEMIRQRVLLQLDIREQLTPEQREKIKQLQQEFRRMMQQRNFRRGADGPPAGPRSHWP